jgi:hypothetical protein
LENQVFEHHGAKSQGPEILSSRGNRGNRGSRGSRGNRGSRRRRTRSFLGNMRRQGDGDREYTRKVSNFLAKLNVWQVSFIVID